MKIYTKTGDRGETSLYGGTRVAKYDNRVVAYGTVDEANCALGVIVSLVADSKIKGELESIQSNLFTIGSVLSGNIRLSLVPVTQGLKQLEKNIDRMESTLPTLRNFILPGGGRAGAAAHMSRSIVRRAEREVCRLSDTDTVDTMIIIQYLNRLSDYCFVLARFLNHKEKQTEVIWKSSKI